VIGRGVTAPGGRPHAEPQAISQAGPAARGATLYCTLEPCSHHGKSPPCVDYIIAAGIARVVTAVLDPDPRVAGRGCRLLKEAGLRVDTGVGAAEAEDGLLGFLTHRRLGRPAITLKLAVSPDGRIGKAGGPRVMVTGEAARHGAQALRLESDAILVGIETALADDPLLTTRLPGVAGRQPIRVVLDGEARLPLESQLVRTAHDIATLVITAETAPPARVRALKTFGVDMVHARRRADGRLDPADVARLLGLRDVMTLLIEGGAAVAGAFLDAGLVDRVARFDGVTPIPDGTPAPAGLLGRAPLAHGFSLGGRHQFGPDTLTLWRRPAAS
jgi:diaminohydroxyphosphoribosylaminopyrimidine deaminase/5-amino-6-(5-phosphoribosylamino)uracil reductase